MSLVLEVEYLSGVSYAALGPDSEVSEWPPQPDRVFSALTASWAARGQDRREADALEWLERQPTPCVLASGAGLRTVAVAFVPPNDPRTDRKKHAAGVIPAQRSRQPRRFPSVRPDNAVVRFSWREAAIDDETLGLLDGLARDTSYVGHSASLTRCRFLSDPESARDVPTVQPTRSIYPGRFAELRRAFDAGRRPLPGALVTAAVEIPRTTKPVFGDRWLVLEHVQGDMPDVRACATVAKTLRDAVLSGYARLGLASEIPEMVSGHAAAGTPSRQPHMAVIPLPFVGAPHADGHVLGFALVPPSGSSLLEDLTFKSAMRAIAPIDEASGRRYLTLRTKSGTPADRAFSIVLTPTLEPSRRSLESSGFTAATTTFATVTPLVLDRHLKERGASREAEVAEQIAIACQNIGLPRPTHIEISKHSAVRGAVSAYPSSRSPAWMRWRVPGSLAGRFLTHAVIQFDVPVTGPVLIGAGRFIGLGLCRPVERESL